VWPIQFNVMSNTKPTSVKKAPNRNRQALAIGKPDPALNRLNILIGTWNLKGRTLDSKSDDVTGWNTFEWLPGRFFLKSFGEINFKGFVIKSIEIIRYDQKKNTFPSIVYSNVSGDALSYEWDVRGRSIRHSGLGAKYSGTISKDGNTLTGSWRPDKDKETAEESAYDAVMTRVKRRAKTTRY